MASSIKWNADIAHFVTFYKYFLGLIGLWVLDENVFSRIRWFVWTMIEFSSTITMLMEVIRHCHGHEDALNAFLSVSTSITSLLKLLLHRVTWRYKLILVKSIIENWTTVKNPDSRDIMLKYARIGRMGSLIFFYFGCASVMSFVYPVISANLNLIWISEKQFYNKTSERKLILSAYCVFENYTSFAYVLIEVLQLLQLLINCISQCGNDGFFFDLTINICGQFEILKMDFAEMNGKINSSNRNNISTLLRRHYHLIYLARHLQKAFGLVIMAQLLMSVLLLCVEGFQLILSLKMHDAYTMTRHSVFIGSLLTELLLYCIAGQTLESRSQELAYAIYESPWYNFDTNEMKNLPLMILRASNPHRLTAGRFIPINFESFKEILKASASYLSVLRVMLE